MKPVHSRVQTVVLPFLYSILGMILAPCFAVALVCSLIWPNQWNRLMDKDCEFHLRRGAPGKLTEMLKTFEQGLVVRLPSALALEPVRP